MRLGIDASNLRSGGSVVHLPKLLSAAQPEEHGITRVTVWGGREILRRLPERDWLFGVHERALEGPLPARVLWQQTKLATSAMKSDCDILFVPGGTYLGRFRPFVAISRNMLPFESSQARLYGVSRMRLKLLLLRQAQERTLKDADGMIFLHEYGRSRVLAKIGKLKGANTIIPHGVSAEFRTAPRPQRELRAYSEGEPFRLLYVSAIEAYKHHGRLIEAISRLVRKGLPLTLDLVGPAAAQSVRKLNGIISDLKIGAAVRYRGSIPHEQLPSLYSQADAFVFTSSCENLPNALLEAMAAGLPIACSNKDPMPKILGEGASYFDPENTSQIVDVLHNLLASTGERERRAEKAYKLARAYTWERCAHDTFAFLNKVAHA